jgi:CsoR family transcriptional regulator, copper-sensing transcriptional repressor
MTEPIRHAHAFDPNLKRRISTQLKRIEGQIRGVQRMVEEERYCADVLMQISAIHESLRSVAQLLLRNHLQHCATDAIRSRDGRRRQEMVDELSDLYFKHVR